MANLNFPVSFDDGTIMLVAGSAPFSTRDVWEGFLEGLHDNGANVLPYPTFSVLEFLSPNLLGSDLIGKAMDIRNAVKAVVFISGMNFRGPFRWVVESLKYHGMPTVLVATDDPYDDIEMEEAYSLRFTNELACVSDITRYLPAATIIPPTLDECPYSRDLVFVGTLFEDRWRLIEKIAMYCELNERRFDIFGHFPSQVAGLADLDFVRLIPGTVSPEMKWNIYNESKFVLNIFRDARERKAFSASPRVYEVAAMGRPALITNRRPECDEIFGDSIFVFDSIDDFELQIERGLEREVERKQRVLKARDIALKSHLFLHRAATLMQVIRSEIQSP